MFINLSTKLKYIFLWICQSINLDQFFVPLNPASDIENCEVTVRLKLTGSELWSPSLPDDDLWDDANKQLAEVFCFKFLFLFSPNTPHVINLGYQDI